MEVYKSSINIFNIKGSFAGAFGIPQFLPSNYIKFGVDGNGDGKVSLFTMEDAVLSTANYLAGFGWKAALPLPEKRKVIWNYNRSEAYVSAVLGVAEKLKSRNAAYRP